ncbi:putative late blight resistance protein homolog R1B-12 isoform X5 [Solanum tuberosum]|uniref:putative late blight resistance protein homolog R1B-12 isoform X5 n=1 Tax=Solanum tuberosum TaxID=4113 RepID=UPI00073A4C54|nr:PREDICTED: putative late blight resistance protein homolog R1B-12 isoform X5 [Solanum tuberosum]
MLLINVNCPDFPPHSKSFLSLEDSWNLFTEKIFKKDPCPPLLEETGKHIVQQCQGLPLSVVVVAGLLGKMDPTHDNWKKVEENLNSFFGTVSERCQSILSLSYNYLPQYLKACFLYVGGFPEDREINVSKLIRLWIAEQFVKARNNKRLEVVAEEYLEELIDRSLILTGKQRANGRIETCKIHDLFRQLCLSEVHTENIVYYMNGNVLVSLLEVIHDQRRVIDLRKHEEKQVYINDITSITRTFISMQYDFPERICSIVSKFKLLKVLDVLSLWYDFSCVIPELVHLRYVAARIDKALSLDKLRNLQIIILQENIGVNRSTKLEEPVDIWRMSELRHVDIDSPLYISNPLEAENPLFLNNLQNLYLYNSHFIVEIIKRTPNLKKLKFIDESENPDWSEILDSLILLEELETLLIKLESIDLNIFSGDILSCKIKKLSPNIKKLILLGTYIPWEVVNLLANLPNLEVISGEYAFSGTDWKVDEDVVFRKLKYLQIGEADLERWEATGSDNFPMLEQLILYGFDTLEEIPESIGDIMTLKLIQVDNCSSSVDNSAKRIQQEQESLGNYELQVRITPKDEEREGYLNEAGDDYTASHYILPHLLNLCSVSRESWSTTSYKKKFLLEIKRF